jgi:hypothetical protein
MEAIYEFTCNLKVVNVNFNFGIFVTMAWWITLLWVMVVAPLGLPRGI